MRIIFFWDWPIVIEQAITWKDGLAAAIRELSTRHEIKFLTMGNSNFILEHPFFDIGVCKDLDTLETSTKLFAPDVIFVWGDCTRPGAPALAKLGKPMALCFAGGDTNGPMAMYFDHFFVESAVYFDRFVAFGKSVSRAFGVNTELFDPLSDRLKRQQKVFDVCNLSTAAEWKRQPLLARACEGLRCVQAGYMYLEQEMDCWRVPQQSGWLVMPHVSAEGCAHILAASKVAALPSRSDGGSQRSALEAMAMNVPLVVCDSDKLQEYVRASGHGVICEPTEKGISEAIEFARKMVVDSRPWILENYSHITYARSIEQELLKLCGGTRTSDPFSF